MEQWKSIKGYDGIYEVSNLGRVKSLERKVPHPIIIMQTVKSKILKKYIKTNGYEQVVLYKNSIRKDLLVHRLVAEAFLCIDIERKYVNHKDGVKHNNNVENLEWCTQKENVRHSMKNGTTKIRKGSECGKVAKLNEKQVLEIKMSLKEKTNVELGNIYGVRDSTISMIRHNHIWNHIKVVT